MTLEDGRLKLSDITKKISRASAQAYPGDLSFRLEN